MKRLSPVYSFVFASVVFCSCGNKTNTAAPQAAQDSINAAQAAAESKAAAEALWIADSQKLANLETPDLQYMEAKGPVKSITYSEPTMRYEYSRTGQLVLIDGYDPFTGGHQVDMERMSLTRNQNGEINNCTHYESSEDYEWKNGRLTVVDGAGEGYEWRITYEYDDKGLLRAKKGKQGFVDGGEQETVNTQYTYLDFDSYGNWTRRKVNGDVEKRVIKYFTITRPSDNPDDFDPTVRTYNFRGKIGGEKDCPLQIGKEGGYYVVASGKKTLVFADFDPKTSELVIDAFKPDGVKYIGRFTGKVSGKSYKGTFANGNKGKVNFDLTME